MLPCPLILEHSNQEWFRQSKPKKVRFANFGERSPELVPEPPFACKYYTKPLKKGVSELILDSFPEISRTSLSSVWFARASPDKTQNVLESTQGSASLGREEKTPTPRISALLGKRPVLLRANFVLTKDRKRPYYGHFCGKMHREGSCSKAAGGP